MKCHSCSDRGVKESNADLGLAFVVLLASFLGSLVLNGCTAFEIGTQMTNLSDSGFLARIPETPKQREFYAAMPAYKLQRGIVKGNAFYACKDDKRGVVYLGNEASYQRYMEKVRMLVSFYETTEAKMTPTDMDTDFQWRVYDAWGDPGAPSPQD